MWLIFFNALLLTTRQWPMQCIFYVSYNSELTIFGLRIGNLPFRIHVLSEQCIPIPIPSIACILSSQDWSPLDSIRQCSQGFGESAIGNGKMFDHFNQGIIGTLSAYHLLLSVEEILCLSNEKLIFDWIVNDLHKDYNGMVCPASLLQQYWLSKWNWAGLIVQIWWEHNILWHIMLRLVAATTN